MSIAPSVLDGVAVIMLTVHSLRRHRLCLTIACVLAMVGVWAEKGMGLVVPGFVPTPLGDVFEYSPAIPIELRVLRYPGAGPPPAAPP